MIWFFLAGIVGMLIAMAIFFVGMITGYLFLERQLKEGDRRGKTGFSGKET